MCVCTQNVYVRVCLYICVSYVWGRVRRGSEREDGATMTDWREFGLDSAGKGESCRLSWGKLIRYEFLEGQSEHSGQGERTGLGVLVSECVHLIHGAVRESETNQDGCWDQGNEVVLEGRATLWRPGDLPS